MQETPSSQPTARRMLISCGVMALVAALVASLTLVAGVVLILVGQ